MKVSVFGLGKVGVPLVASLAKGGHDVIGVDVFSAPVEALNSGKVVTNEAGVHERLAGLPPGRVCATTDAMAAVRESEISFVIVPTPSNTLGGYSLRFILETCTTIGNAIKAKGSYHVVAIISTVLPGSSERYVIPALEEASGLTAGQGFGYCYNPTFIALGEVVKGFVQPDYLLIGQQDDRAGDIVLQVHRQMIEKEAPEARMTPTEAEICKLASNTYETMRVSFANMLLSICSEVPGANADHITDALAHRMGKRFFRGATPFGGPCWPRDNEALSVFMEALGAPSQMPRTVDLFNDAHGRYILGKVLAWTKPGDKVGILGMAYKTGTNVIERSYAVDLARFLIAERRQVVAWDPLALNDVEREMGDKVQYAASAEDVLGCTQATVITNPLREFAEVDWSRGRGTTVIDTWRCLSEQAQAAVGHYAPLGVGPYEGAAAWLDRNIGGKLDLLTN
jgi:UDPglucose 6-dehydrogenase